jgi:hypothetical protein
MNDFDRWIHEDGPAPRIVRDLLGAEHAGPEAPSDEERLERATLARIDASAAGGPDDDDEPKAHEAPPSPAAQPEPSRGIRRAPAALEGTGQMLDLTAEAWRALGKLPFVSPDEVPPKKRAARTEKCPVMPNPMSGTLPLGEDTIQKLVAAFPFEGVEATTTVHIRDMKLQTYTCLCAELRARRRTVEEIRVRYGVPNDVSLRALHEHWVSRFEACPEAQAWFWKALPWYAQQAYYAAW